MENSSFQLSCKVSGIERKVTAAVIAAALSTEASYSGAPRFSYQAGGWTVDREGMVLTPETPIGEKDSIRPVLDALKTAGASVEGNATVTVSLDGHNGITLKNLVNLIYCKQALIQKSLAFQEDIIPESFVKIINSVMMETLGELADLINTAIDNGQIQGESQLNFDLAERTISFSFANATLDADEVLAFLSLCWQLNEQARKQKFSSAKQKDTDNDKFSFRVWLIRLGFVGAAFATDRKVLLARLSGDAAFRTETARQAAEAKRKAKQVRADA